MDENLTHLIKLNSTKYFAILDVFCISLGELPLLYSKLLKKHKLSLQEYKFLKHLWYSNFEIEDKLSNLIPKFFETKRVTKQQRNSFQYSLEKLSDYGLITYVKVDFYSISVRLSSEIYGKSWSYYSRYINNLSLFYIIHYKNPDKEDYQRYKKFCEKVGNKPMKIIDSSKIDRQPIRGIRKSITDIRVPIVSKRIGRKINFNAKKYQGLSEFEIKQLERLSKLGQSYVDSKLKQMRKSNNVSKTTEMEMDCIDNFVPYYENLICKATGRLSYELLDNPRNKKLSRRWTSVFKTYKLCVDNDYDWKIYLDSQFEAFSNWENKSNVPFPMPNMLYSERAIKAYENYVYHNETAYNNEGWDTKLKAKDTGTYYEETERTLKLDLNMINNVVQYSLKKSFNKTFKKVDKTRPDLDSLYYTKAIQLSWEELSVECWAVIPQMESFLDGIVGMYDSIDAKISEYKSLVGNPQKLNAVREIWNQLELPKLYGVCEIDDKLLA